VTEYSAFTLKEGKYLIVRISRSVIFLGSSEEERG